MSIEKIKHSSVIENEGLQIFENNSYLDVANYEFLSFQKEMLKSLFEIIEEVENFFLDKDSFLKWKKEIILSSQEVNIMSLVFSQTTLDNLRKDDKARFHKNLDKKVATETSYNLMTIEGNEGTSVSDFPLQSACAYILLSKYMPNQDKILFDLADDLSLNSEGIKFISSIINEVPNFSTTAVRYDLYSYINQNKGSNNYATSLERAEAKLRQEKVSCGDDLERLEKAISVAERTLEEISLLEMSEGQKEEFEEFIRSYVQELQILQEQLTNLLVFLNKIAIFPPDLTDGTNSFEVSGPEGWDEILRELENIVVNGELNKEDQSSVGGLTNFFSKCVSDQQNFSDIGQGTQLAIQLELSAVQQEWSIVSVTLRLLHRIYQGLIQNIKLR